MPDPRPRPLPAMRYGNYDNPPATDSNPPYPNRHFRLQRALRTTREATEYVRNRPPAPPPPPSRRRQRSRGQDEDEHAGDDELNAPFLDESRQHLEDGKRRQAKRRKLDYDSPPVSRPPIRYGHYGQVEPGRLKLDIVSCDGGEHTDPRNPSIYLGPFNILKLDKSVYCSDRSSAGFVLRHADDTPFCLEKLHIVGPEHGFTAPVREGIVHVAMTLQDLCKYQDPPFHARRAGLDPTPYARCSQPHRHSGMPVSPERLSLTDALRDPEINAAYENYARHADSHHDLANQTGNSPHSQSLDRDSVGDNENSDEYLSLEADEPVTMLSSDDEAEQEETTSPEILDYRLQRLRQARRRYEIENWDREDRWHVGYSASRRNTESEWDREHADSPWSMNRLESMRTRPGGPHDSTSTNTAATAFDASSSFREKVLKSAEARACSDPAVTTARFYIKRAKYKVSIKFDPPVSGRFILLKMWGCGPRAHNVDVQSVVAKGFGGPRFFPAVQVR